MPKQKKYILSACLIGKACFYDGSSRSVPEIKELFDSGMAIALCPEELAGFKVPRPPIEIFSGTGEDVLRRKAYIFNKEGKGVTINIIKGSKEFLRITQDSGVKEAVLKAKSPCCGKGSIYDGTFSNKLRKGNGVTADLLLKNGIKVVSDEEFLNSHKVKK